MTMPNTIDNLCYSILADTYLLYKLSTCEYYIYNKRYYNVVNLHMLSYTKLKENNLPTVKKVVDALVFKLENECNRYIDV